MRTPIAAVLAVLAISATAIAADPPSGKVSKASPTVTWKGEMTTPYASYGPMYLDNTHACEAPSCDRFTLEVADGPADLTVKAAHTSPDGGIEMMRITKPNGDIVFGTDDTDQPQAIKIKAAPSGQYFVDITNGSKVQASYEASATLAVAATPPPTAGPTPPQTPPVAPAPPVTVSGKAPAISAKKANKIKKLVVSVTTNREAGVKARLLAGKKLVGTGTLAKLNGTGRLTMKLKKLKAGRHTLVLEASDGQSIARTTIKVKVKR